VRFRRVVIAHGLDRVLFERVTADLKARAITVKTGTLVDATIIASASEADEDGRWVKHKGRAAVYGFKAHVGADASTALIEQVAVTPANANDGRAGPDALPEHLGEVFADSAYRGAHFGNAVRAKGGSPHGRYSDMGPRRTAGLDAGNAQIHRIRARIAKIFGTWKRSYGLRRMRWRGLARAAAQVRFTAIASNLKRCVNILAA
jgi:IS5 family transposase